MCPNTHRTQSNLNQSIIKQKILWKIYWKKNASSRNYLNLSLPPLYFQIKIYDENWFVLSMVLSERLTSRAKWTNTIMSSSGLLRSFKSILNCWWKAVWALKPSPDGEEWSRVGWWWLWCQCNYCCCERIWAWWPEWAAPGQFPVFTLTGCSWTLVTALWKTNGHQVAISGGAILHCALRKVLAWGAIFFSSLLWSHQE